MNIANYIHQLLLENDLVIIPGFGAFVSTYKSAEIDKNTNELKPPSKEISFNQQIRNNDGLLVGRVAEGEAVSHFDALKKIEQERENIIFQLDKEGKVYLEETGELFVNENNEIQLKPDKDENPLLDSFGLESVSVEHKEEKTSETETHVEPEKTDTEKETTTFTPETKDVPQSKKDEPENRDEFFQSIKQHAPRELVTENISTEKKKRSWLWLLLILAPIIVVGIYITINKTNIKNQLENTANETGTTLKELSAIKPDSIVTDSISELSKDSVPTNNEDTITIGSIESDSPKYILVGGSFKEEENADTYLLQLKEEGFEPFQLGKRGNFYIVGIGKYKTIEDALAAKNDFNEKNPDSGVWVHKE
jgi:cell division protein FtsN